ncbi:DUF2625 family protein [Oerskovia sp. NPDC060338]|uniref:DUF2625 family protein n=1 Tax=Oerskovia sp. NPDC060338 TaxID=3347100 RepID=UPI0036560C2A
MGIRTVSDLTQVDDPAWPTLARMFQRPGVEVLAPPEWAPEVLYRLQITTRSTLGALALYTGGVLVDHGWLRLLGGGGYGLPDLATINGLGAPEEGAIAPQKLVVAFDVLGGTFAVNGGGLPGPLGDVHYFAPDTLEWHCLGFGQGAFTEWAVSGGLAEYVADLRWPGWELDIEDLPPGTGLSVYPPLWSGAVSGHLVERHAVVLEGLAVWHQEMADRMSPLGDGLLGGDPPSEGC